MFRCQHPGGEGIGRVFFVHRHRGLHDDWSRVGLRRHEMDARAVNLDTGRQRTLVRIQSFECRQERRVDVEKPALPALHERWREQPHEAGEADEIDLMPREHLLDCLFERRPVAIELPMVDDMYGNSRRFRARKAGRLGPIGDHEHDLGRIGAVFAGLD